MNAKQIRKNRVRKGFTLLEILLVVGLLALLAAFAIPALVNQGEQAKIDLAKAAIRPNGSISQAIKMYKFNTGQYPENLMDLIEKPSDDDLAEKWTGPYLEDAGGLKDPWGKEFQYQYPGDNNEDGYDLYSLGPNGIDGDDDDIKNWEDS